MVTLIVGENNDGPFLFRYHTFRPRQKSENILLTRTFIFIRLPGNKVKEKNALTDVIFAFQSENA